MTIFKTAAGVFVLGIFIYLFVSFVIPHRMTPNTVFQEQDSVQKKAGFPQEENSRTATVCPQTTRLCKDGSTPKIGPNCDVICPTDRSDGGIRVSSCTTDTDCASNEACVDQGQVMHEKNKAIKVCQPKDKPGAICLSKGTRIATPNGDRLVEDLHDGDVVWSIDVQGVKFPAFIKSVSRTKTPVRHMMVHLILKDGRELKVSPLHPLADGREVANIGMNDIIDGSIVTSVSRETYEENFTYDILPQSESRSYWANDIPVLSTIK